MTRAFSEADLLVEFATVGKSKDGHRIIHHLWRPEEIDALLNEQGLAKKEEST